MGTMKLYELVNHYHIGTDLTCAEAMFMACNEYYHLNLSEETRKMFSVMGLGMQTEQSCCGAFTVAVGIIGLMTAKDKADAVISMDADLQDDVEAVDQMVDKFLEGGGQHGRLPNDLRIDGVYAGLLWNAPLCRAAKAGDRGG